MIKNKKAQEMNYIIFIAIFIVIFGIISSIFLNQVIAKETMRNKTWFSNLISLIDSTLKDIPVIGTFWEVITSTYNFVYVHNYLGLIYGALFGIPLGYILIRLIKGGG